MVCAQSRSRSSIVWSARRTEPGIASARWGELTLSISGEHNPSLHVIDGELGEVHDDLRRGHTGCEVCEDVDDRDSGADEAGFAGPHARPLVDQRSEIHGRTVDPEPTIGPIRRQVAVA